MTDMREIREVAYTAALLGIEVKYGEHGNYEAAAFRLPGTPGQFFAAEYADRVTAGRSQRLRIARGSLMGRVFSYLGKAASNLAQVAAFNPTPAERAKADAFLATTARVFEGVA